MVREPRLETVTVEQKKMPAPVFLEVSSKVKSEVNARLWQRLQNMEDFQNG